MHRESMAGMPDLEAQSGPGCPGRTLCGQHLSPEASALKIREPAQNSIVLQ